MPLKLKDIAKAAPISPAIASPSPINPPTDYGKEPTIEVGAHEDIGVGDKVRINSFYLSNYSGMDSKAQAVAEVVEVAARKIRYDSLDKDGRPMFVNRYGKHSEYDLVSLWIRYEGDSSLYLVSPFGYDKVS